MRCGTENAATSSQVVAAVDLRPVYTKTRFSENGEIFCRFGLVCLHEAAVFTESDRPKTRLFEKVFQNDVM